MPCMRLCLGGALVLVLLAAAAAPAGYYPRPAYHGTDHQAQIDCWDCHWFDAENAFNASHISPLVIGADDFLYSITYEGPQDLVRPSDKEDPNDRNGICQVCHTQTKYWGASYDWGPNAYPELHFPNDNCLSCHPHWQPDDLFRPQMKGPQSHETHLNSDKGPKLPDCFSCHYEGDYSRFLDGQTIATTTACDDCHSRGGAVDGVDDPVVGAKTNWLHGVYDGDKLKEGKEHWCDGCHDAGKSVVLGVQAPNVIGDNLTCGYNVSGHGRNPENYVACVDCHDASYVHCDGEPRTYKSTPNASNYVEGYRLGADMNIPRPWQRDGQATDYALCLSCHDAVSLFSADGIMKTNFRNDRSWVFPSKNLHRLHLIASNFSLGPLWDSDWDGVYSNDSPASCPACHNVHGSTTPQMTRDGALIGRGDGLNFRWYAQNGRKEAAALEESRWGASDIATYGDSYICVGCHGNYSDSYFRVPYQVLLPPDGPPAQPLYSGLVWTSDYADNPETRFAPGEVFKVHCVYYVLPFSPAPPYRVIRRGTIDGAFSQKLARDIVAQDGEGVHEATWNCKVPEAAAEGKATIKVVVKTSLYGVTYAERRSCTIRVAK